MGWGGGGVEVVGYVGEEMGGMGDWGTCCGKGEMKEAEAGRCGMW